MPTEETVKVEVSEGDKAALAVSSPVAEPIEVRIEQDDVADTNSPI